VYNPTLGTFTNRDPIGYAAGDENLYRYVADNPADATDPLGLAELPSLPNSPDAIKGKQTLLIYEGVDTQSGLSVVLVKEDCFDDRNGGAPPKFLIIPKAESQGLAQAIAAGLPKAGAGLVGAPAMGNYPFTRFENPSLNPLGNGFQPTDPFASTTLAQHVLNEGPKFSGNRSPFISLSRNRRGAHLPSGKPYGGVLFLVDEKALAKSSGTLYGEKQIYWKLVEEYGVERADMWKRAQSRSRPGGGEGGESVFRGRIPANAVTTKFRLRTEQTLRVGGKALLVYGIYETTNNLLNAADESIRTGSETPIVKQTVRETGGWGGAIAGAEAFAALGALAGIETGPGAIVLGLAGGLVGGTLGYFGADVAIEKYYEAQDVETDAGVPGSQWVPQGLKTGAERYQGLQGYLQLNRDLSGDRSVYGVDQNGVPYPYDPFNP
jgi:hypothetical protein